MSAKNPTLAEHLATLSRAQLRDLLAHRPGTLVGWANFDLRDLAEAWVLPWSMIESLTQLPRPAIEVLETVAALVQGVTIDVLADHLQPNGSAAEHRQDVTRALDLLRAHGLAWVGPDGGIWISSEIDEFLPRPLGLGPGVDRHVRHLTVWDLKGILAAVGLPNAGKKNELAGRLLDFYLDSDRIVEVVAAASDDTLHDLVRWVAGLSPLGETYDPDNQTRVEVSFRWGRARGLLFGYSSYEARMPAPVVMALRGRDIRAEFHPDAPELPLTDVSVHHVNATAGSAATYLDSLSLSVLDAVATQSIQLLAKGGVGVRELNKLADRVKASSDEVRLVLELAFVLDLLWQNDSRLTVGRPYDSWRNAEPADRVAELIAAWWNLGHLSLAYRTADGKAQPALQDMYLGGEDTDIRHHGVEILAGLSSADPAITPSVTDQEAFAARMTWERPLVIGTRSVVPQAVWDEAHLLGVFADGACTPAGRALLTLDSDTVKQAVRAILPTAASTGTFGSDLTVMVAGAPTAAAAQLLDACADRESRGQASIWRLSPASVRRAFDNGWAAEPLTKALQDMTSTPLPQTLTYLIGDVERRHGHLQVAAAGCCVVSQDTALLTEVCAARPLRHLGLRLLAPTVALAAADRATTLAALRTAGYMPIPDGGGPVLDLPPRDPAWYEQDDIDHDVTPTDRVDLISNLLLPADTIPPAVARQQVEEVTQRIFPRINTPAPAPPPTLFP